jgi:indolepyruvate ferredoxin oxidoreductase beta subunit
MIRILDMTYGQKQQILISGLGGQGILFITRLMAEAAILKELPVLTSETHGMAQRGGTVVSHLKVGGFSSPLIRPGQADILLVLQGSTLAQHAAFLKPEGLAVINSPDSLPFKGRGFFVDANRIAHDMGDRQAANLLFLGFTLARVPDLFFSVKDMEAVIANRWQKRTEIREASIKALRMGMNLI